MAAEHQQDALNIDADGIVRFARENSLLKLINPMKLLPQNEEGAQAGLHDNIKIPEDEDIETKSWKLRTKLHEKIETKKTDKGSNEKFLSYCSQMDGIISDFNKCRCKTAREKGLPFDKTHHYCLKKMDHDPAMLKGIKQEILPDFLLSPPTKDEKAEAHLGSAVDEPSMDAKLLVDIMKPLLPICYTKETIDAGGKISYSPVCRSRTHETSPEVPYSSIKPGLKLIIRKVLETLWADNVKYVNYFRCGYIPKEGPDDECALASSYAEHNKAYGKRYEKYLENVIEEYLESGFNETTKYFQITEEEKDASFDNDVDPKVWIQGHTYLDCTPDAEANLLTCVQTYSGTTIFPNNPERHIYLKCNTDPETSVLNCIRATYISKNENIWSKLDWDTYFGCHTDPETSLLNCNTSFDISTIHLDMSAEAVGNTTYQASNKASLDLNKQAFALGIVVLLIFIAGVILGLLLSTLGAHIAQIDIIQHLVGIHPKKRSDEVKRLADQLKLMSVYDEEGSEEQDGAVPKKDIRLNVSL